tara:strand:- start:767 stop:961 length:195 start_codon:yes stop_codon:yes gene_type:complete
MIVFILMVSIGGQIVSRDCDQALCFADINRCLYFAERINQQPQGEDITAFCQPLNADEGSRYYR